MHRTRAGLLEVLLQNSYYKHELELQVRKCVGLKFGGTRLGGFFCGWFRLTSTDVGWLDFFKLEKSQNSVNENQVLILPISGTINYKCLLKPI